MKKYMALASIIMLFLSTLPNFALENRPIEVVVNSKKIEFRRIPTLVNGSLMVPAARLISELKGSVAWDSNTKILTVKKAENTWVFRIGKKYVKKNGKVRTLEERPYLDNGMVMIPVRYVSSQLGETVRWDGMNRRVIIGRDITLASRGKSLSERVVVIDPGHGGSESGAVYAGILEKDLNLQISKRLRRQLIDQGIKVYMTREYDQNVGLYERSAYAKSVNADILVSVHNNAGMKYNKGSMTLFYPTQTVKNGNLYSKKLAEIIQKYLINNLKMKDWGVIPRPNLAVLRTATIPAVIVEIGFMSNQEELNLLKNTAFQERAAAAIKYGIIEALSKI